MRRTPDPNAHLRQIPGLGGMSNAELASLVDEYEVPEGTVLMREGSIGRQSYMVVEGWAAVTIGGTPVAALGPGDHVGEMAMMDSQPRSATVTAKTPMKVLVVSPEAIERFLDQPRTVKTIARGLSARLRVADPSVAVPDGDSQ